MTHTTPKTDLRYISMFSGIEAATAAWHPLGWTPVVFAEIEPFPSAVLAHHYPAIPNVGDMTKHDWAQYRGSVDLVVAGAPCQAFSVAGLRESLNDARGNLTLETVKAVHAIDPEWFVFENVPGILNTDDNAFGCFIGALVGADDALEAPAYLGGWPCVGAVTGPARTVAWRILDAQFFGLAQRRRRVFGLSTRGTGNWRCAVALFPVADGLSGNPPARREAGQGITHDIAPCLKASGVGFSRTGDISGQDCVVPVASTGEIYHCLNAGGMGRNDYETETLITHALRAEGFDASEDGTGRGTPIVAHTLTSNGDAHSGYKDEKGLVPVAFDTTQITSAENGSNPRPSDPCHPLAAGAHPPAVALGGTLGVRRITPTEAERLQGFPDGYTLVPYRGKPAKDAPRYKALGNSMAVPCMHWLGKRIQQVEALCPSK